MRGKTTLTRTKSPADEVQAAEETLAAKRAELEQAVAAGDVELVMTLRTFTEVEGPRALTAAKVAKLDSDILELEQAVESGDLQREEDDADAQMKAIQTEAREVHEKLHELTQAFDGKQAAYMAARRGRFGATARLAALGEERDRLTERSEVEIAARIRELAGLPPETVEELPKRRARQGATSDSPMTPRESLFAT